MTSWIQYHSDHHFPIQNIPFGICSANSFSKSPCTRIGDHVLHLKSLSDAGLLDINGLNVDTLSQSTLNDFISLGKSVTNAVREKIQILFSQESFKEKASSAIVPISDVEVFMPVHVGDYTDFYSSEDHARNVGKMFRDPENALLPNWKHIPVGYHGRASSIIESGKAIVRPKGQMIPADSDTPVYGPCKLLDFELEVAFVVGKENGLSTSVRTSEADEHMFGYVLFNDWSARDIQKWEYVPLGPFLGKNFASTISPWIVTIEALEPFRVQGGAQDPVVLPYLEYSGKKHFDVQLEVAISCEQFDEHVISRSNMKYLYWNTAQQLAHHTVNGCNMRVGDMCASGTISGPDETSYGSMLELSWRGTKPLQMPDGSTRKFIQDYDTVHLSGYAQGNGFRIGFGDCKAQLLPAK